MFYMTYITKCINLLPFEASHDSIVASSQHILSIRREGARVNATRTEVMRRHDHSTVLASNRQNQTSAMLANLRCIEGEVPRYCPQTAQ